MYLKSLIMIALITALYACPFTNAFVSEYFANNHTGELEESKKENTVINEGTFAAAYSEPENTSGESIPDISDRSAALNNTESSSVKKIDDAEDIAAGQESDMLAATQGKNDTSKRYDANTTVGENGINETKGDKNYAVGANNYDNNIMGNNDDKKESDNNNVSPLAGNSNAGIDANKIPAASSQPADSKASTAPGQPVSSNASATPSQPVADNVNTGENSSGNNASTTSGGTEYGETNRHNTSIYEDDSLIRVEYYDDDNNLYEYSDVTGYNGETGSYTETVYRYDEENEVEVPVRKDTYVNGELVSSEYY